MEFIVCYHRSITSEVGKMNQKKSMSWAARRRFRAGKAPAVFMDAMSTAAKRSFRSGRIPGHDAAGGVREVLSLLKKATVRPLGKTDIVFSTQR